VARFCYVPYGIQQGEQVMKHSRQFRRRTTSPVDRYSTRTLRFASVEEYLRKLHPEYDFIFSIKESAQARWKYTPQDAERTQTHMIQNAFRGSEAIGSRQGIGDRDRRHGGVSRLRRRGPYQLAPRLEILNEYGNRLAVPGRIHQAGLKCYRCDRKHSADRDGDDFHDRIGVAGHSRDRHAKLICGHLSRG
jgi:hypothetical protein